eukprot:2658210-Rhodomonas_salina.2
MDRHGLRPCICPEGVQLARQGTHLSMLYSARSLGLQEIPCYGAEPQPGQDLALHFSACTRCTFVGKGSGTSRLRSHYV